MVMYTKKEMAELLGVSKSTVYRFIQENGIKYDRKKGILFFIVIQR
ncbi:MAG TPA: helix-turn-helix domain-containing protein [Candidatus Limosilactobacillus intestinavium]|nr:helix-turn-helix domain-containing protein [Candidatus Limosilactobacillus intestinavium]